MEEILQPIYRIEDFWYAIVNGLSCPHTPIYRIEQYLAYLCGADVSVPQPIYRIEQYLAYKCGLDVELPEPIYRQEMFLAKWCGMDVEPPTPIYRIETLLSQLSNGELKTVTGNPISISDALEKPAESLTIEILPQQSGSGDPSPDNVRPISGFTGVNIQRTGKNLLEMPFEYYTATASKDNCFHLPSGTYTFSFGSTTETSWRFVLRLYDEDGNEITSGTPAGVSMPYRTSVHGFSNGANTTNKSFSFTLESDAYVRVLFWGGSTSASSTFTNAQLELGSTATDFEQYQGNLYTIDLDGTVYGGTLDVTNGVLTVDRAMVVYDGSEDETWNISSAWGKTNTAVFYTTPINGAYYPDLTNYRGMLTNLFLNATRNYVYNNDVECCGFSGTAVTSPGPTFRILKTRANTVADFRTFLSTNNLQFCYELATPIEIQLTPTQVDMLLGDNVLWNDVGDMTLEYLADGPADDADALQILLGNRYVNNGGADEATDREALDILLGGR